MTLKHKLQLRRVSLGHLGMKTSDMKLVTAHIVTYSAYCDMKLVNGTCMNVHTCMCTCRYPYMHLYML